MIKFFRHIRQQLIQENEMNKYFKYAFGEILLVVIGILIALQINNWNENRKSKLKEKQILNEIVNSIDSDLRLYESIYDFRLKRKKNGIDSLLLFINKNDSIEDFLFMNLGNQSRTDIGIRYDSGPYDALKSIGFDIIRNDSLRSKIINAYEVELPAYKGFVEDYNSEKDPIINKHWENITESYVCNHNNIPLHFHKKPKYDNILNNQEFLELLHMENQKYNHYQSRLKNIKRILNEVKTNIEMVLKQLD